MYTQYAWAWNIWTQWHYNHIVYTMMWLVHVLGLAIICMGMRGSACCCGCMVNGSVTMETFWVSIYMYHQWAAIATSATSPHHIHIQINTHSLNVGICISTYKCMHMHQSHHWNGSTYLSCHSYYSNSPYWPRSHPEELDWAPVCPSSPYNFNFPTSHKSARNSLTTLSK